MLYCCKNEPSLYRDIEKVGYRALQLMSPIGIQSGISDYVGPVGKIYSTYIGFGPCRIAGSKSEVHFETGSSVIDVFVHAS